MEFLHVVNISGESVSVNAIQKVVQHALRIIEKSLGQAEMLSLMIIYRPDPTLVQKIDSGIGESHQDGRVS